MKAGGESARAGDLHASIFTVLCSPNEIFTETLPSLTLSDVTEQSAVLPISINI